MSKVLHIHPALAGLDPEPSTAPIAPGSSVSPSDIQQIMQRAIDERAAAIRNDVKKHGVDVALLASSTTFIGYFGAGPFGALVGALAGAWWASSVPAFLPSLGEPRVSVGAEPARWTLNGVPMGLSELQRAGREAGRKIAVQWLLQERPDVEAIDAMLAAGVNDLRKNAAGEDTPYDDAIAEGVRTVIQRERVRLVPDDQAVAAAAEAQEVAARAAARARQLAEKARGSEQK